MRFKTILIGSVTAFMAGCSTTSYGVLPFGKDTYTITVESFIAADAQMEKDAITQAVEYCTNTGKLLDPVSTRARPVDNTYTLIFRCLAEDDPGYRRPNWESVPDVVIENRQ